jgi:hypothetical protein
VTGSSTRLRVAILIVAALLSALLVNVPSLLAAGETLGLSPSHGQAGDGSSATGAGFPADTAISLTFDGGSVGSGTSDPGGAFSIGFTVPGGASPGDYTVTACADVSATCDSTASSTYTVDTPPTVPPPAMDLTPSHGQPGDPSTAGGTGFAASAVLTLDWDGTTVLVTDASDGSGAFSIGFTVPADATPGGHTVTACATVSSGCDGGTVGATYTVDEAATPSPTSGSSPTTRPSPGLTQTPEPTTTHLLTATPLRTLAPGETPGPTPTASPVPGSGPAGGAGGGTIDPRLLLLAGAFVVVLLGAWAFFRYGPSAEGVPGPLFGPTARLVSGLFAGAILLAVVAGGVIADAGRPHEKVVICHLDTLHGSYRPIRIDGAAVVVHQLRGDVMPDAAGDCP